jgi:predicted RND superfamily exporter protein
MNRIIAFILRRPRAIISMLVVLSAFFAYGLWRGVQLDVSPLGFVERDGQARADFETARKNFGPDDYLVVAAVCDDVFAPANTARLRDLHDRIAKTKGVAEVLSLVNAPYARSSGGVVSAESLIPDGAMGRRGDGAIERRGIERPREEENGGPVAPSPHRPVAPSHDPHSAIERSAFEEVRRLATGDRLYVGNLVSADSDAAALNILLKSDLTTAARHVITHRIYDLARGAGFDQVYFAGDPFTQWRSTEAVKGDLRLFLPLTLVFIALLLWLCFRSFVVVALLLSAIGIGLLWLMGLMAWFESHFTILALMLPTLMVAIGCSYMVHVINQIGISQMVATGRRGDGATGRVGEKENGRSEDLSHCPPVAQSPSRPVALSSIEDALRFISLPVIVSAMTIIAGFLSLAFTAIPAIRSTAIYSAIGAAFTMILSLTFIPAAMALMGERAMRFRVGLTGGMVRRLEGVGRWATSNQTPLYILTAVLVAFSAVGASRIVIDIDYFHFSKPNSETSVGLAEVNKRLSGAINFDIIVEGKGAGAIETPEVLRRIAELQSFAETRKSANGQGVDRTLSVVDFVKHINRAFHDNDQRHYDLPSDEGVLGELLSDRDRLRQFLTTDGRIARILVRSNLSGSQAMAGAIREIEARGRELLPEFRVFATGTFVMLNRTSDQIAGEQLLSVSIALVTIYLTLSALFGSLRVGFTALVPNLIPILFFFGFMGWRGVELNLTTSLVASVVLGLAVDNSVQFIARFRRAQVERADLREAILESMRLSGRPIIYANVALAATFAIFCFSNFKPIASFGLLSAVTIIGCLIEDLVLLPARLTSPVFRAK